MTASPTDDLDSAERRIQQLTKELSEAREHQAATAGILAAMSSSPTDPYRAFADIAASAARLCDAQISAVLQLADGTLRLLARYGPLPTVRSVGESGFPFNRGVVAARAIIDKTTIHVADLLVETKEYPESSELARRVGHRTVVAVPLMRAGQAIGAIVIRRAQVRPFTDRQIELLKVFADQAVIAIENARLFVAEQTRTRELTERTQELSETLKYQTATSEVLNVISRSPSQLQPVLDTIVETAGRLCQADYALIFRLENGKYRLIAASNAEAEFVKHLSYTSYDADRGSLTGRVAIAKTTIHIPDVLDDPEYARGELQKLGKYRTVLGVPLMRDGQPIGVINLSRTVVQPFTEKQIEVITTFANQAVIAIENTRLFEAEQASKRELQESLDYQTSTSEVLGVISRSPTDVQPVFDTIARNAARLCSALFCFVYRFDGKLIHFAASDGLDPEQEKAARSRYPLPPSRASAATRAILNAAVEEISDIETDPDYEHKAAKFYRSIVAVPMLKDGCPIGAIAVSKPAVGPFPRRQIELLETFADQAVIAIENARLFEAEKASKRELQ